MNVYLMEFYDEYYKSKSISKLKEFTYKTFPKDGTDKLFIGCTLILITSVYKTRATAEALATIISSVNENVGSSNLLEFYLDRVNGNKLISKYLCKELKDKKVKEHAKLILEWLDCFTFDFSKTINSCFKEKIENYKKSK